MTKVSIVVPIYKVEAYLERCIDSLIGQTLTDIEIILVDDGSPDGCPAICDRYAAKDRRIKVIHKKNGGVSAARNDGLAAASGDYVIFCDSDDWMELDACEVLYTKGIETGSDVVVGDINRIKGDKMIYNQYFANEFHYTDRENMDQLVMADIYLGYCPNPPKTHTIGYGGPWNKLVKRQFLLDHNINFDVSLLGLYDDILYTAYVYANMGSIVYIQKPVYNYVVVQTSITKTYKANSLDISNRIFKAFSAFIKEYAPDGRWDKAFDALVVRRFEENLRFYFFSDQNGKGYKEIINELKETMAQEPYASAERSVEIDRLETYQARVAKLLQAKSATGLWALYKLKKLRSSVGVRPEFSVIVPVYNVEPYLERCVESLVNQTLKDIEIILVDDGSPDGCPEICDRYAAKDNRITVIHKKNEGVSAARNDGLAAASGEWVICFDSDDWAELDACENLYNAGASNNADVVIADIYRVNGEHRSTNPLFKEAFEFTESEDIKNVVISAIYQRCSPIVSNKTQVGFGGPWNKAVRGELIAEHGLQFDTDVMGVYDDRLFALDAYANAEKIVYIQKLVYNYVLVDGSLTRTYKKNLLEVNNAIFEKFSKFVEGNYRGDTAVISAYNAMVVNRLRDAFMLYFFSEKNPDAWEKRKKEMKAVFADDTYKTAISDVEESVLYSNLRYEVKVMKLHSPVAMRIWYKVKGMKQKAGR